MALWYRYVCQECGYSGLTRDREKYVHGTTPCLRCGSLRFEVQETDAAPLPDEDERAPKVEED